MCFLLKRKMEINKKKESITFNESHSDFQIKRVAELMLFIMSAVIFVSIYLKEISLLLHSSHQNLDFHKILSNCSALFEALYQTADDPRYIIKCIDEHGEMK